LRAFKQIQVYALTVAGPADARSGCECELSCFLSLNSKYNDDVTDELNIQSTELVHLDNITALYRDVTVTIAP